MVSHIISEPTVDLGIFLLVVIALNTTCMISQCYLAVLSLHETLLLLNYFFPFIIASMRNFPMVIHFVLKIIKYRDYTSFMAIKFWREQLLHPTLLTCLERDWNWTYYWGFLITIPSLIWASSRCLLWFSLPLVSSCNAICVFFFSNFPVILKLNSVHSIIRLLITVQF